MVIEGGTDGPGETTPMMGSTDGTPSVQVVPAGMDVNLTCEVPEGGKYLSWALIQAQGDQLWPLDTNIKNNMKVCVSCYSIVSLYLADLSECHQSKKKNLQICQPSIWHP